MTPIQQEAERTKPNNMIRNAFSVFHQMNEQDTKDNTSTLAVSVHFLRSKKVSAGYEVTFGIDGETHSEFERGKKNIILIGYDVSVKQSIEKSPDPLSLAQQEIERLKGLVKEIDKALYIGGDLEDKDVLDFYIQVAKTIKETIADFKQQHNL
jgi:hypothetical protein